MPQRRVMPRLRKEACDEPSNLIPIQPNNL